MNCPVTWNLNQIHDMCDEVATAENGPGTRQSAGGLFLPCSHLWRGTATSTKHATRARGYTRGGNHPLRWPRNMPREREATRVAAIINHYVYAGAIVA